MFGDFLIMGVGALTVLLVVFLALRPRLSKYRLMIKKVGPKKRRAKAHRKKRKSVWIKVL